jgi:hypothetical protein
MIDRDDLAELLTAAGRAHHEAFSDADGFDPEWPLWYAEFLAPRIEDGFDTVLTRSELVYLLVASARAHDADDTDRPWADFYAEFITEQLAGA